MRARIVAFKDGRRLEQRFEDHHAAAVVAKKLKRKGIRFAFVLSKVPASRRFPPSDDDLTSRNAGMMWCPYCGAWRWFRVPRYRANDQTPRFANGYRYTKAEENWFLNAAHRLGQKICPWCYVSEDEFSVKIANGTWNEKPKRRRRKRRRVSSRG